MYPVIVVIALQTTQWPAVSVSGNLDWNSRRGHGPTVCKGHLNFRNG